MREQIERRIRILLLIFIAGLVASGVTAIPLETELNFLTRFMVDIGVKNPDLLQWLFNVCHGVIETNRSFPFIAYGTDWLAFGHFVIAIFFIGPLRDPVKNAWVVDCGIIACVLVIPYALVMGAVRDIPLWWRVVDCSFGLLGLIPLWICRRTIQELAPSQGINEN